MIGLKKATLILGLCAIVGLQALPAVAGLLDTTPYGGWSGNSPFEGLVEPTLNGSIDWAVYAPGHFPFSGYTPADPTPPVADQYTYVYQVHCTGDAAISAFMVGLEGQASFIGWFTDTGYGIAGDEPLHDTALVSPFILNSPEGSANWNFAGIQAGYSSCGLVFCSPCPPMDYYGIVVNHGDFGIMSVSSPYPVPIPEPATISLLVCCLGLAFAWRRFRLW
jgi:hypothetical protein